MSPRDAYPIGPMPAAPVLHFPCPDYPRKHVAYHVVTDKNARVYRFLCSCGAVHLRTLETLLAMKRRQERAS